MNKTFRTEAGSVTLSPETGRVLQVTVGRHDAYWVNPKWEGDWNIGGDRLWVAPELDWSWKTLKKVDFSRYEVPEQMDSGRYKLKRAAKGFCRVGQSVSLKHQHRKSSAKLKMTRNFTLIDPVEAPYFRRCIAYQTDNELLVRGGTKGQWVGLWSLLQVPGGGQLYISCSGKAKPRDYFNPIPRNMWRVDDSALCLDITGKRQYKIGVAPEFTQGTIAYARKRRTDYLVIVRRFFPQPWRTYCDVPMSERKSQGDAVQVYNDGGEFGGFGEMEYHSPAIRIGGGVNRIAESNLTVVGLVAAKSWSRWKKAWLA